MNQESYSNSKSLVSAILLIHLHSKALFKKRKGLLEKQKTLQAGSFADWEWSSIK